MSGDSRGMKYSEGAVEKGSRCEACTNSSLYEASGCRCRKECSQKAVPAEKPLGDREGAHTAATFESGDLPVVCTEAAAAVSGHE